MRLVLTAGLTATAILTGCSSAGPPSGSASPGTSPSKSPVATGGTSSPVQPLAVRCPPSGADAFSPGSARTATAVRSDVTAGFTTCNYRSQIRKGDVCSAATVTINTNPQAFTNFRRWVDETAQNASTGSGDELAPHQINGIGIEADWVPGTLMFETATNSRWITVRLTCSSSGPGTLALAEALARAALAAR